LISHLKSNLIIRILIFLFYFLYREETKQKMGQEISRLENEIVGLKEAKNQMFSSEYVEELQIKVKSFLFNNRIK